MVPQENDPALHLVGLGGTPRYVSRHGHLRDKKTTRSIAAECAPPSPRSQFRRPTDFDEDTPDLAEDQKKSKNGSPTFVLARPTARVQLESKLLSRSVRAHNGPSTSTMVRGIEKHQRPRHRRRLKSVAPSSVHEPLGCIAARKSVVDQRIGAMCPQRLPNAFSSSREVSIRRVNPTRLPIASTRSWSPASLTVPFRSDIIR